MNKCWIGKREGGEIILSPFQKANLADWGRAHPKIIQYKIEPIDLSAKRSLSQNNFYWHYLTVIEQETGNEANDLHEYFKRIFLPPHFKVILGKEVKLPASTTELNKPQFSEYLEKICALTGVPIPNPEDAGYSNIYKI